MPSELTKVEVCPYTCQYTFQRIVVAQRMPLSFSSEPLQPYTCVSGAIYLPQSESFSSVCMLYSAILD